MLVASGALTFWRGHQHQAAATLPSVSHGEWPAVAPGVSAVGDTRTPGGPGTCPGPGTQGLAYPVRPSAGVFCGHVMQMQLVGLSGRWSHVELDRGHAGTPRECCVFCIRFSQRLAASWRLQWAAGRMLASKAQGLSRDSRSPSHPLTLSKPLEAARPEKADSWAPGQGSQFWKGVASQRPP